TELAFFPPDSNFLHRDNGELCGNVFWTRYNQRFHLLNPEDEKYVAEMEKSIYNVALPSQNGGTGICYHPTMVGFKDHVLDAATGSRNSCCEGQGTRLYGSLPEYLYSIASDGLYVDLFAPSSISWKQGNATLKLTTDTQFPLSNDVKMSLSLAAPLKSKIRVRVPNWATGQVKISVDGKVTATGKPGTYAPLERFWKNGDTISFTLPAGLKMTEYHGAEEDELQPRYAFQYGPILLAAVSTGADRPEAKFAVKAENLKGSLQPISGKPLHFSIAGNPDYEFIPYFQVGMEQRFTCYPIVTDRTPGPETVDPRNIALASKGATVTASSEHTTEIGCTAEVIDGIIATTNDFSNRWHSSLNTPHPHWIEVKLPKPTAIAKVIVHFADPAGHPVSFQGTVSQGGKSVVVFDVPIHAQNRRYTTVLAGAPVTDTFRFTIRESANPLYPNAAQISEIELIPAE
ncbi:hypothetical protein EON80_03470, partial [bacterium]